jgi:glycosyltransferase involved in cell wall biosynthesis
MIGKIKAYIKKRKKILSIYEFFFQNKILNVNSSNCNKKVAFVYSTYHFKKGIYHDHSNYQESKVISKIFDELGYQVDVFNNNKKYNIKLDSYDLLFGEGELIYKAVINKHENKVIYYGTGSHPAFNNIQTINALKRYKSEFNDISLNHSRLVKQSWGIAATLSDSAIIIGNDKTKSSFIEYGQSNCITIRPSVHQVLNFLDIIKEKNVVIAKKNILYFSSYGLIHKGLDLIILSARFFPDINFHICGKLDNEILPNSPLYESMKSLKNIIIYGFVDIRSEKFNKIMIENGYCILPSCAEGTSTAIITAMLNGGLIPIVTDEVGVDIDNFGIKIDDLSVESLNKAIQVGIDLPDNQVIERWMLSYKAAEQYSIDNYYKDMKKAIINATSS